MPLLKRTSASMDQNDALCNNSAGETLEVSNGVALADSAKNDVLAVETDDEDDPSQSVTAVRESKKGVRKQVADVFFESRGEALLRAATQRQDNIPTDQATVSLKALMAEAESSRIISNPRNYQLELFEIAKARNTIAVLDTGSGKTLIAVLLLRHVLDQELERRATGARPKTSFFVVDKVALVFQQYGVLLSNLDQKVQHLCGSTADLWKKENWDMFLKENMVIVCTADVLYQSLFHSFTSVSDMNLLIFDEAHHAKKDHAYAKIIRDFYVKEPDSSKRPRIFGMTASPVDIEDGGDEVDLLNVVQDLETILHAKIATPEADAELQQHYVVKPKEMTVEYDQGNFPYHTPLYSNLVADCGNLTVIQSLLLKSKEIARVLGSWCGDKFWSFALTDEMTRRREDALERSFAGTKKPSRVALEKQIEMLKAANEVQKRIEIGVPSSDDQSLSPKVLTLHSVLQRHFELPTDARCLVFVEERITARLLASVFQQLDMEHMRADFIVGSNGKTLEGFNNSVKQQVSTLMKFRKGQLNCLFATSVAEEGLDIQDCNVVIRFDLAKTTIQYIQSRGRARRPNSIMYHLVERYNFQQIDSLSRIKRSDDTIKRICNVLPKDRIVYDSEYTIEDIMEKDRRYRQYTDKTTGAVLNYNNSRLILANFADSVPHDPHEVSRPFYYTTMRNSLFVSEVILPPKSPVASAIGQKYPSKSAAKASAAFEACIQLRKGKHLTEYLLSTYQKKLHILANARLALNGAKKNTYSMVQKPKLWESGRGETPEHVYLTILLVNGEWDRPIEPIGLLTRNVLPRLPEFFVYRMDGKAVPVKILRSEGSIQISENTGLLEESTQFTLTILRDIFNKKYEYNPARMSYWLVPLSRKALQKRGHSKEKFGGPAISCIDRTRLSDLKYDDDRIKYRPKSDAIGKFVPGSYLVDNWTGAKRYFTRRVDPLLTPDSPVPSDSASITTKGKQARTILDFTVSLWRKSKEQVASIWDSNQPVVEVEAMSHRLNVLAMPTEQEKNAKTQAYVCLEPLDISRLDGSVAGMAYLFPAIIHRIEDYLISMELCGSINLEVGPALALEALTKDSENSEEAEAEKIHFQSGMGPNYERLEFLGDTFLKMATTIAAYVIWDNHMEFDLHCDRMSFTSNTYLYKTAVKKGFPAYIRSKGFSRRTWYPEGLLLLEGKNATRRVGSEIVQKTLEEQQIKETHSLKEKTIADVCEALIGAAFVEKFQSGYSDSTQFDNAVTAITEVVGNPQHNMRSWKDYHEKYVPPAWLQSAPTASQRNIAEKVEEIHDYHFKQPQLLRCALMHPSIPRMMEGVPSYERLEFLGDALLDMAHVSHLFYNNPGKDPGWLTEHKMAMVSNQFCGALAVKLGLWRYMRHSTSGMSAQIATYVKELGEAEKAANGAVDYWTVVPEGPKCLADIVESFVGAIFIDSGFNYAEVQRFWDQHIYPFFKNMSQYDSFARSHPIRLLHRLMQESFTCNEFSIIARELHSADGLSSTVSAVVVIHDTVAGDGDGKTGRVAKVNAANAAYLNLKGVAPAHFRETYGCDCMHHQTNGNDSAISVDEIGTAV